MDGVGDDDRDVAVVLDAVAAILAGDHLSAERMLARAAASSATVLISACGLFAAAFSAWAADRGSCDPAEQRLMWSSFADSVLDG